MAWFAMASLLLWGTIILAGTAINPKMAEMVADISAAMAIFVFPMTSIVLAYFGVAAYEHGKASR